MGGNRGGRGTWSREADRKWQLWSGAFAALAQAAAAARSTGLPHAQWCGGRQRCEQTCPVRDEPGAERWLLDAEPPVGGQFDPKGGEQSSQVAHCLHYRAGAVGLVRAEVQGNFLKEKKRFLADLTRIEKEAWEAEEHQTQCRLAVRNLVLGVGVPSWSLGSGCRASR